VKGPADCPGLANSGFAVASEESSYVEKVPSGAASFHFDIGPLL